MNYISVLLANKYADELDAPGGGVPNCPGLHHGCSSRVDAPEGSGCPGLSHGGSSSLAFSSSSVAGT